MPRISAKKKFEQHQRLLRQSKQDPVTLYLDTLAPSGRRSISHLLDKGARLIGFTEKIREVPWHLLEYQHVVQIRTKMVKAGYSLNTVNLMLAGLKGVVSACFDLGLMSAEEMLRIKKLKRVRGDETKKGRALTKSQISRLLDSFQRRSGLMATRDQAVVAVLLATGIRRSEICSVRKSDYNSKNGELVVRSGKGRKARVVFLHMSVRKRLKKWIDIMPLESEWLFVRISRKLECSTEPLQGSDVYTIVRTGSDRAGLGKVGPHDLRRTFVTSLLENGIDVNVVRQLAGHKQLETTARYDKRDVSVRKKATKKLFEDLGL
jgi:integrase